MTCENNCGICNGRLFNEEGVLLADREVIPFFKLKCLKLRYPQHPLPPRYFKTGLLASLLSYSQALCYNRAHKVVMAVYYTENVYMLRYSQEFGKQFGMPILHTSELRAVPRQVCEFNVD